LEARKAVSAYVALPAPNHSQIACLASHALRLACLDTVVQVGRLEPHFETAAAEDVDDLVEMLSIAPFGELLQGQPIWLNPGFGDSSMLQGERIKLHANCWGRLDSVK
jgi:hypothetical protein